MFLEVPDLLSTAEVAELLTIVATANFVGGRISYSNNPAKDNLQLHDLAAYARSPSRPSNARRAHRRDQLHRKRRARHQSARLTL